MLGAVRFARLPRVLVASLCLAAAAAGTSAFADDKMMGPISGLQPVTPAPDPAAVKPGLAVTYYFNFFRRIRELEDWMKFDKGRVGEPIPQLDYDVGPGNVLTTTADNGVGAQIEGMINFPTTGAYEIQMQSNDGVRLTIGGQQILEDPDVHSDRMSDLITLNIEQAGWYPLKLLYFERKGTSTLQLFWTTPDDKDNVAFVPAESLGHIPKQMN
jgi:hypothetical protein